MTKDGTSLAVDPIQLISGLFALLPLPVAITDNHGKIILANSSFTDTFAEIGNLDALPHH